jgi:hypothetical protein
MTAQASTFCSWLQASQLAQAPAGSAGAAVPASAPELPAISGLAGRTQSASPCASQPFGQHPSPLWHTVIGSTWQRALQVSDEPE